MNKLILSLALLSAIVPVGCGGGSGLGPAKTQSGVTPTPVTPQSVALTPTTFTLQNGQRVTLTGTRTGTELKGNLKVLAATAQPRLQSGSQNVAFPFSIALGDYGYTGTFTPPRGFTINGNFGSLGSFTMSGQLQTATENGSYSLTTNGVTDTGVLPATGTPPTPNGTATPAPTTPATGGFKVTGDLRFSGVSAGSPVITAPLNSFANPGKGTFSKPTATPSQSVSFGASDIKFSGNGSNSGTERTISIGSTSASSNFASPVPFSVGQRFDLDKNRTFNVVQYSESVISGTAINFRIWRAQEGELVVKSVGADSIGFELVNAKMQNISPSGTPDPTLGTFTLNGTVNATGLTVKTN